MTCFWFEIVENTKRRNLDARECFPLEKLSYGFKHFVSKFPKGGKRNPMTLSGLSLEFRKTPFHMRIQKPSFPEIIHKRFKSRFACVNIPRAGSCRQMVCSRRLREQMSFLRSFFTTYLPSHPKHPFTNGLAHGWPNVREKAHISTWTENWRFSIVFLEWEANHRHAQKPINQKTQSKNKLPSVDHTCSPCRIE